MRETSRATERKKLVLTSIRDYTDKGGITRSEIQTLSKEEWGKQIGTGNLRTILLDALTKGEVVCYGFGDWQTVHYYAGPQWGKVVKWLRAHGVEVAEGGKPVAPKETPKEKKEREWLEEMAVQRAIREAEQAEARLHPDYHSCCMGPCHLWNGHPGEHQSSRKGYADSNNDWIIDEDGRRPWWPGWKGAAHEDQ